MHSDKSVVASILLIGSRSAWGRASHYSLMSYGGCPDTVAEKLIDQYGNSTVYDIIFCELARCCTMHLNMPGHVMDAAVLVDFLKVVSGGFVMVPLRGSAQSETNFGVSLYSCV